MRSRRLNEACKKLQEDNKSLCDCQKGLFYDRLVMEPCIKPCDPLLESFLNGLVG